MNATIPQQLETKSPPLPILLATLLLPLLLLQVLATLNPRPIPTMIQQVPTASQKPQHWGQLNTTGMMTFCCLTPGKAICMFVTKKTQTILSSSTESTQSSKNYSALTSASSSSTGLGNSTLRAGLSRRKNSTNVLFLVHLYFFNIVCFRWLLPSYCSCCPGLKAKAMRAKNKLFCTTQYLIMTNRGNYISPI